MSQSLNEEEEGPGNTMQADKIFPGPEDYGSGTALIDMIKTVIQDLPLKINLLRLMYITNIKNFITAVFNLEDDDDTDLGGMTQRVKNDFKRKAKYIDDYLLVSLERSLENVEPETKNQIMKLFDNISVSAWPIMNMYHFFVNVNGLLNTEKIIAMRDQFKGKMKSQFNQYRDKVKDKKVMENIMSMKDKIIKKTEEEMKKNIETITKSNNKDVEKENEDVNQNVTQQQPLPMQPQPLPMQPQPLPMYNNQIPMQPQQLPMYNNQMLPNMYSKNPPIMYNKQPPPSVKTGGGKLKKKIKKRKKSKKTKKQKKRRMRRKKKKTKKNKKHNNKKHNNKKHNIQLNIYNI
tara:strand:+ start:4108 stop:5148 length:1041 start_codon:yes stop_codon:yes gene_type:complete